MAIIKAVVDAINEINRELDAVEAADLSGDRAGSEHHRAVAATLACRSFRDITDNGPLLEDLLRLGHTSDEHHQEALARIAEHRDEIVEAELTLLHRVGVDDDVVEQFREGLAMRDIADEPLGAFSPRVLEDLRSLFCEQQAKVTGEVRRGRRNSRLRGAVLGLGGAGLGIVNASVIPLSGGGSAISGVVAGALLQEGFGRAFPRD